MVPSPSYVQSHASSEIGFGDQFTGARGRHAIHGFESGYASPLTILGTLPSPDYHRWRAAPDRALLVPFA
jgi:hypothetical protein